MESRVAMLGLVVGLLGAGTAGVRLGDGAPRNGSHAPEALSEPIPKPISEPVSYNRDVRPILSDKCFACHGPDSASREAGLRLDRRDAAVAERRGGAAIVPGDPDASEVIHRVFADDPDLVMPPPEAKLALTEDERETLRRWIAEGAAYEPHWSFVALPERVDVPEVAGGNGSEGWARDPIDRFVLALLDSEGLAPSPEASRERWIRRVSYDLTGLPPTPEEVDAFLADEADGAHARVVDRVLASTEYGERMAVPWLDMARYADSYGFQSDLLSPTWPWRDWVVRAFNDNVPYDQFITRQLAGDLAPGATRDDRLATAFNRLHRMTNEGGSIPKEWRIEFAADRVETFGTAVLGLTLACARCHDHKYDPISQREYYELTAYFNSIDEHGLYEHVRPDIVPTPSLLLPTPEQEARLAELASTVERREPAWEEAKAQAGEAFEAWIASGDRATLPPDIVGRYPLDAIAADGSVANTIDEAATGRAEIGASTERPVLVEGRKGKAIRLDGDNVVHVPGVGDIARWTPFTVSFWVRDTAPDSGERVVAHRSGGTDSGHFGFDLMVSDGHLVARAYRHWPGNAIAIATTGPVLDAGVWTHITWRYDGSSRAAGLALFINGRPVRTEIVRDRVWKTLNNGPTYGPGGRNLVLGQRFRDRGLASGEFDDVLILRRAVTDAEVRWLFDADLSGSSPYPPIGDSAAARAYFASAIDEPSRGASEALQQARRELAEFENAIREIMVMEEMPAPRATHLLARGEYDAPTNDTTLVSRRVPEALGGSATTRPADRYELAAWLTDPDHPLTARVAINRLWQMCFGQGLVATSEDFGLQGELPSHPELLDWLAREFVESGWDTKAMLKRIVLSATYRQDSVATPELFERDPENRLLARGPSRRLDGEMIRDTALAASGLLAPTMGGPPVSPYQPPGLWKAFNAFSPAYQQGTGEDLYRRSVYTVWKRTAPMPSMVTFDAPGREMCVVRRSATNTPLQALVLLNDTQYVEASRVLAERAIAAHAIDDARLEFVFRRLTGRRPVEAERTILQQLAAEQRELFTDRPEDALALLGVGDSPRDESLDPVEVAAWTVVAQAVLNADATVWQR